MKLKVENMKVVFSKKDVINDINFSVEEEEFVSVLGASGCGKSTFLKAIAGILPLEKGNIFVDGKKIDNVPAHKRNIVLVFQDIRLFPHMTVAENIGFALKIKKVPGEVRNAKVKSLLQQIKMDGLENRKINQLSGGQQQRVALARALAAEPEILMLDEPFSSLDENLRFDMRLLLLDIHKKYHMTTIMVTHNKDEALSMSDKIALMDEGRIIQSGSPEDIYENPVSYKVAEYFGDASFFEGTVGKGKFRSPEFMVECSLEEGEYMMMVRNDAVEPTEGDDFEFVQRIYTGKEKEYIYQHCVTGSKIRCRNNGKKTDSLPAKTSFRFKSEKLRYYKI